MDTMTIRGLVCLAGFLAIGSAGCGTGATAGRSPVLAFGAPAAELSQACTIEGDPRVVATHVVPKDGVTAVADGSRIWLRFGTTREARVSLAIDPGSLQSVEGGQPPVVVAPSTTAGPVELGLPGGRRLVAWTAGSLDEGMRVKAVTVNENGAAAGPEIDLGYEGSAIGRPAVALDVAGQGALAFGGTRTARASSWW